jgi:hypothetical protein
VGWVSGGSSVGAAAFCVPCVSCISVVVVEGASVRDCRCLGLCKVGIVSLSVGDECVGGRCSLVTGWGRMGGEGEFRERQWMSYWGGMK